MSRATKYRAWANGKMHDVRAISFTEVGEVHRILDSEGVQRVPEALLQFTGLKDRNGKEIYEGDILNHTNSLPASAVEVIWLNGSWNVRKDYLKNDFAKALVIALTSQNATHTEIVGNIYENPKLLAK